MTSGRDTFWIDWPRLEPLPAVGVSLNAGVLGTAIVMEHGADPPRDVRTVKVMLSLGTPFYAEQPMAQRKGLVFDPFG